MTVSVFKIYPDELRDIKINVLSCNEATTISIDANVLMLETENHWKVL